MIVLYIILAPLILWGLFLMYCALHASMKSGKFYLAPWPVRACSYVLLGMMIVADIAFNFTIGWALNGRAKATFRFQTDESAAAGVTGRNFGQAAGWTRGTA